MLNSLKIKLCFCDTMSSSNMSINTIVSCLISLYQLYFIFVNWCLFVRELLQIISSTLFKSEPGMRWWKYEPGDTDKNCPWFEFVRIRASYCEVIWKRAFLFRFWVTIQKFATMIRKCDHSKLCNYDQIKIGQISANLLGVTKQGVWEKFNQIMVRHLLSDFYATMRPINQTMINNVANF